MRSLLLVALSLTAGLFDTPYNDVKSRVELQQLIHGVQGLRSTLWRGTFYCGTRGDHHFIRHSIDAAPDICFRIRRDDLKLTEKKYPVKAAE